MHLCEHDACICETAPDGEYCSERCRRHGAEVGPGPCGCGHPLCVGTSEDPLGVIDPPPARSPELGAG
jgi:hypothetical protein